jgi:hypothetical protein
MTLNEQGSPESGLRDYFRPIGKESWRVGGELYLWLYFWVFALGVCGSWLVALLWSTNPRLPFPSKLLPQFLWLFLPFPPPASSLIFSTM